MPDKEQTVSATRTLTRIWRRTRCRILPYKNAVSIGGKWHPVSPVRPGPTVAIYDGRPVPAWWVLECGRVAEFVGIYDDRASNFNQPPTGPGETIIGTAIYRVG